MVYDGGMETARTLEDLVKSGVPPEEIGRFFDEVLGGLRDLLSQIDTPVAGWMTSEDWEPTSEDWSLWGERAGLSPEQVEAMRAGP